MSDDLLLGVALALAALLLATLVLLVAHGTWRALSGARWRKPLADARTALAQTADRLELSPDGAKALEKLPDERRIDLFAELKRRDREVRTHEQAHKASGGAYTGSIRLSYQMGPDGKRYAVEGSVPIDVSPVPGDPAATLRKMEVVHRAANAPASPSSADRAVAAQAQRATQQARAQMAAERYAQASELVPRA